VRAGDAAVKAIFDWIEKHDAWDDSVVIVTSDHGHAFMLTAPEAFTGGL
jgi:alkaline phosphatase